jgi:hypothetical protein
MADLVDVQNALASVIAAALYPNGSGQPSSVGVPVTIYPGWPTASQLDADLLALSKGTGGYVHATIYPTPMERNTTRYGRDWKQVIAPVQTLTLTQNGQQVTIGGTVSVPQNVMLMVNRVPVVYQVLATDTLNSIAAALAALVAGASSTGAVVTLPNSAILTAARVGASGTNIQEIRRQERVFQISIWADTPAHRDSVAAAVDVTLAALQFLTLPDGTGARLIYKSTVQNDTLQKANLYRRDLMYSVEYATTVTEIDTQITQDQTNVSVASDGVSTYAPTATIYF